MSATTPRGTSFYAVGGQQRPDAFQREEWERHKRGVIVRVDLEPDRLERVVEYVSPPEAVPEEEPFAILFKAATRVGDRLYACTQTEILVYELPSFRRVAYLSLPSFNDLHHVLPRPGGTLLIANTGLDMVEEVELDEGGQGGRVIRRWNVLGGEPWGRFDPQVDYRKVASTKPHGAHPNCVFEADGEIWVTRFEQRDALCLTRPERRIEIGVERPHDGVVHGRRVYFTTVDGRVVIGDLDRDRVERVVDLNAVTGSPMALGWCRGILVLDDERVVVGFSRLRPTQFRENLRWIKHRVGLRATPGNLPSRLACYDLKAERLCWERNLEEHGLSVVFSIHHGSIHHGGSDPGTGSAGTADPGTVDPGTEDRGPGHG